MVVTETQPTAVAVRVTSSRKKPRQSDRPGAASLVALQCRAER